MLLMKVGYADPWQEIIDGQGLRRRKEVYGQEKCQNDVVKGVRRKIREEGEGKKVPANVLQEQTGV